MQCLQNLLTEYFGASLRLVPGRKDGDLLEYVARIGPNKTINVTVSANTTDEEITFGDIVDICLAIQIGIVPESKRMSEFQNIVDRLEVQEIAMASKELDERCLQYKIKQSELQDMNCCTEYVPEDSSEECRIFVYSNRMGRSQSSVIASGETGLSKEGNLLQVLRMNRTTGFVFNA